MPFAAPTIQDRLPAELLIPLTRYILSRDFVILAGRFGASGGSAFKRDDSKISTSSPRCVFLAWTIGSTPVRWSKFPIGVAPQCPSLASHLRLSSG